MTVLSDRSIKAMIEAGDLAIEPFDPKRLQPASYDLTLGPNIKAGPPISTSTDVSVQPVVPGVTNGLTSGHWRDLSIEGGLYRLLSGEFILAQTIEHVAVPNYLVAKLEGKSTLGRWGLVVHVTAGFVDPGFRGQLTLELKNVAPWPIDLHHGMPISQIAFQQLSTVADRPYEGRYQGQTGVQPGRISA